MTIDKAGSDEMEGRIPTADPHPVCPLAHRVHACGQSAHRAVYLLIARHGAAGSSAESRTPTGALVEDAVDVIYATIAAAAGLDWDEGPDVGGPVGPISRPSAGIFTADTPSC